MVVFHLELFGALSTSKSYRLIESEVTGVVCSTC